MRFTKYNNPKKKRKRPHYSKEMYDLLKEDLIKNLSDDKDVADLQVKAFNIMIGGK